MICRFNLAIEPAALPRPRHALRGKFVSSYYPKKIEQKFNEYTKAIKGAFNALSVVERENISEIVKIAPTGLKIALSVVFRLRPASSLSKKKKNALYGSEHNKKPDLDNLLKMIIDRMSGVFYKDDNVIHEIHARKEYAEVPGIEITLEYKKE